MYIIHRIPMITCLSSKPYLQLAVYILITIILQWHIKSIREKILKRYFQSEENDFN